MEYPDAIKSLITKFISKNSPASEEIGAYRFRYDSLKSWLDIFESKNLLLGHVADMNDNKEFRHGVESFLSMLRAHDGWNRTMNVDAKDKIEAFFLELRENPKIKVYISSFSRLEDSERL